MIRGRAEECSLNICGFQICPHESAQTTFADDALMKEVVYPEVEQLLKQVYEKSFKFLVYLFRLTLDRA